MGDFGLMCWTVLSTTIIKAPHEGIYFGRMVLIPPVVSRHLQNQCRGALKLLWQHVVAKHFTKTLYVVFSLKEE